MPLTLNVGLAKELRQPDGRSLGATCDISVKLDAALLGGPDAFHRRVRNAYAACRQAVNRELARQTTGPSGNGAHGVIRRKQAHAKPISQAVAMLGGVIHYRKRRQQGVVSGSFFGVRVGLPGQPPAMIRAAHRPTMVASAIRIRSTSAPQTIM